jgi:hypothetical protein
MLPPARLLPPSTIAVEGGAVEEHSARSQSVAHAGQARPGMQHSLLKISYVVVGKFGDEIYKPQLTGLKLRPRNSCTYRSIRDAAPVVSVAGCAFVLLAACGGDQ